MMLSRRHKLLFLLFLGLITTTVGCSDSNGTTSATPTATAPDGATGPAPTATIFGRAEWVPVESMTTIILSAAEHPELGTIVIGPRGHTLYLFMGDEPNKSNCTGGCAATWPPLLASGVLAQGSLQLDLFAPITRDDGISQVTYNGHALYKFSGDKLPGDANGQGVVGQWFVVSPEGEAITTAGGGTTAASGASADSGPQYDY